MRDKETDKELLQLRALFNEGRYAELRQRALYFSDWLDDRGRHDEAGYLRSPRWYVLIMEGQGWPPPCVITGEYVPGISRHIYLDSEWIAAAELVDQVLASQDDGQKGAALLHLMARAIEEKFPPFHNGP